MLGKLRVNADHYLSKDARMYYVFDCTIGDALKHLFPRYRNSAIKPFKTAYKIIDFLQEIIIDLH